jgi:SAM-dependent methyltransferase
MASTLYDDKFYLQQRDKSLESARIIAPLVMKTAQIKSVVDVGCGMGGWLRAFAENGVAAIRGVDGAYVDKSKLYIAPEYFSAVDLTQPLKIDERFDLAVCVEVAEHLPARTSSGLIRGLTQLAPVVLFSASVPGQGGTGHINEQWPECWQNLFTQQGFTMLDLIRPIIREDRRIDWWYRQNIALFASEAAILANPGLRATAFGGNELEWVHVNMLRQAGVRNLLVHLWPALNHAIRTRLPVRKYRNDYPEQEWSSPETR